MPEEKWYQNPEKASQAAAVIILALAALLTWLFAGEEVKKMFALAVSGDVEALAAYFRSFGAWAMLISFLLDVLINAGSIFPSLPLDISLFCAPKYTRVSMGSRSGSMGGLVTWEAFTAILSK